MILCTWNVRGLNDPHKIIEVGKFIRSNNISCIGLVETKVAFSNINKVKSKLCKGWHWVTNGDATHRGRIWIGWNPTELDLTVLHSFDQVLHCQVQQPHHAAVFFTVVYGVNDIIARRSMWDQLKRCNTQSPWLISGDFNAVLHTEDRHNGRPVTAYETQDFEAFMFEMEVFEVQSKGCFFSWNNKGQGSSRIASRIDRGLGNTAWMDVYGCVEAVSLPPGLSDHSPIIYNCQLETESGGRPFRFLNALASHEQFSSIVQQAWSSNVTGSAMLRI